MKKGRKKEKCKKPKPKAKGNNANEFKFSVKGTIFLFLIFLLREKKKNGSMDSVDLAETLQFFWLFFLFFNLILCHLRCDAHNSCHDNFYQFCATEISIKWKKKQNLNTRTHTQKKLRDDEHESDVIFILLGKCKFQLCFAYNKSRKFNRYIRNIHKQLSY